MRDYGGWQGCFRKQSGTRTGCQSPCSWCTLMTVMLEKALTQEVSVHRDKDCTAI
jgi:hypothetical protein